MVYRVRQLITLALVIGFFWLVGSLNPSEPRLHVRPGVLAHLPKSLPAPIETIFRGAVETASWVHANAGALYTIILIALVPLGLYAATRSFHKAAYKDPQRLFTQNQRDQASQLAGGRCEMETVWFTRCRRSGSHGDHWIPHSKGGATSMTNQVWACATCNLSKSARMPGWLETVRVARRRRRYFPANTELKPGETYRVY